MVNNFKTIFKPTISRQQGFVDVKLMKLSKAAAGKGPGDANYRLLISFQTEALREKWVASDDHQRVWPKIAGTLKHDKLNALVYDIVA